MHRNTTHEIGSHYDQHASAGHRTDHLVGDAVGYWPFDMGHTDMINPSGVLPSTGYPATGSDGAGYTPGRIGDGSDLSQRFVDLGQHPAYNISMDVALSLWARHPAPMGNGAPVTLLGARTHGLSQILDPTTGALQVQVATATTTQTAAGPAGPAGTRPDDGQWHQVMADLSNDRLRIILDGTIVLDDDTTLLPDGSTVELTTADTWDGTLDEIVLFDRALTNWEILSRSADTTFSDLQRTLPDPYKKSEKVVVDRSKMEEESEND